jgi:hypothetical protein
MLPSGFPAVGTPAFSITTANCLGAGLPFPRHFFVNLDGRHRVIAVNFKLKVRFLDNRRSELPVFGSHEFGRTSQPKTALVLIGRTSTPFLRNRVDLMRTASFAFDIGVPPARL